MYLSGHEFTQLQSYLISFLQQFLKDVVPAYGSECREGEFLNWSLDVCNRVISFSWYFYIVIDCCIDLYLDVVSGEGFLSLQVDYVCFHVDNIDFIGKWVEIL